MEITFEKRIIFFLFLAFIMFSYLFSSALLAHPLINRDLIKFGDYLREDYVSIIEKTYSPAIAASRLFNEPISITSQETNNGIELMVGYNFHEGGVCALVKQNGMVTTQESCGVDASNLSLILNDDTSLLLGFGEFKQQKYIFVGKAERFVAEKTIVGNYIDAKGIAYSFNADGSASFGIKKFKYCIGLDYIERGEDVSEKIRSYFSNIVTGDLYEFEFKDGFLNIYKTSGEMLLIAEKNPFLKLKKTVN